MPQFLKKILKIPGDRSGIRLPKHRCLEIYAVYTGYPTPFFFFLIYEKARKEYS